MSTNELRKYRLTSLVEPTDVMLASLMKVVTKEVRRKAAAARRSYFDALTDSIQTTQEAWRLRHNAGLEK